ncbi:hypothetical protein QTP86_017604, partial [Hemibagrus guttatus]
REKEMHVHAPLPAMYIQAVSGLPSYPQSQPAAVQDAAVIPLSVPMMYANQTLPLLTLHIASGAGLQQQRPEPPASSSRPKSQTKHVCPHCGRDCLKPSVLEKHLRCHTGERPYPCLTCGISFKTQSNLYKHKRTQAHARLSSESGKGTFSSQESTESSRENCSSPSLELQNEDSGDTNRNDGVLPAVATSTATLEEVKSGSETELALCKAAVVGVIASPAHVQQVISHTITQRVPQLPSDAAPTQVKSPNGDGRTPLAPNRTPLQRQEALFPKSQSYDSTDSGFSESNEQHSTSSPGATVNDPSMELEEPETSEKLSDEATDDNKSKVSIQKKQELEEHILKLISENNVVMDDSHLVNVRPRKTGLSKQGSIDLPMSISSASQAKTSFLPKYQLKIPVLTDGMSDPCLGKGSSLNPSSTRQNGSLNQQPATTLSSSPQNQASMSVMSPGQGQGPPVSCSLQNPKFHWEAGTGRQKWIPLENKRRGGDGTERVGTWDVKSTWTKQEEKEEEEEEEEEKSMENKREQETKCTESFHKAVKPHPDLSASQHMTSVKAASPELVSITPTPAICGISNPSLESTSPGSNVAPKHTDQSNTKVKEHVSLRCRERFMALSKGPGDMRHLLAHPLLVNAIQEEVQKETQTKNLTHSTNTQVQRPLPERKADGTAQISVPKEPGMTSPRNTDHCQIIKTTPAYTRPSCSNQTNSSCIHPNPTCTSSIHSNPTEPNAAHSYMEEEEEERSSSSDDEGKLVIELE